MSGAFPVWFWALYVLGGLVLLIGFLLALTLSLTWLERRIGVVWPQSRKLGISMFLAAIAVVLLLRLGSGLQSSVQALRSGRAAAFEQLVATTCQDLLQIHRLSEPPRQITAIELAPGNEGLRGTLGNPRQSIPRFAVVVRVETSRDARGWVDVYQHDGRALAFKGRAPGVAELRLRSETGVPSDLKAGLPAKVAIRSNTRLIVDNLVTGEAVAYQDLPVVDFDDGRSDAGCRAPDDRTLEQRYSNAAVRLLKTALAT